MKEKNFKLVVVDPSVTHPYWDEFFPTLEEARIRRDEVNKGGVKVAVLGMRPGLVK